MNKTELKDKLKVLIKGVWEKKKNPEDAALAYDELTKFPELKAVIVGLLTVEYDKFLESIDWVAPRPSTFRCNMLNGGNFLLTYGTNNFTATVEGKRYNLINMMEEQRAAKAISRMLRYVYDTTKPDEDLNYESEDSPGGGSSGGSSGGGSGGLSGAKSTGMSKSEYEASQEGGGDEGDLDVGGDDGELDLTGDIDDIE